MAKYSASVIDDMTDVVDSLLGARRYAVIYVAAQKGWVNAARGLIGRSIRKVLSVKAWRTAPHHVAYYPEGDDGRKGYSARYILDVTDAEFDRLMREIDRAAKADGWYSAPIDAYHD